jgi:hypothetical protein
MYFKVRIKERYKMKRRVHRSFRTVQLFRPGDAERLTVKFLRTGSAHTEDEAQDLASQLPGLGRHLLASEERKYDLDELSGASQKLKG